MKHSLTSIAAALVLAASLPAHADINIGVTVSATGPATSLGAPQKNTATLLPTAIGSEKINWILLDDATDPSQASKNASKFINENKADLVIGSSTVANTAAVVEVTAEAGTPLIALAPIDLPPAKDKWTFRMPQHNALMGKALFDHMVANKVKTLGFIGFSDPYGESWLRVVTPMAEERGIKLVDVERFNRTDTSVTAQVLKLVSARPDAILVVGSGTPAALPHTTLTERGYKGQIYQTHGAPSKEFLKVGGKGVNGGIFVVGPLLVADLLPDSAATKKNALEYTKLYESRFGAGSVSSFGAHMWDAWTLIQYAAPIALKKAKPGTPEFRAALRDAIESAKNVVGVQGVFNMSPTDHFGFDQRARVLIQADNGAFKLVAQ